MKFELMDYEAIVSYNKDWHYPFKVNLVNTKEDNREVFYGEHVTIDQLCFMTHQEMLLHDFHALNPMQTLHAIERMRDGLDLWMECLGDSND